MASTVGSIPGSVGMPVVGVAHVGMGVLQAPVAVLMGMPERAIGGLASEIFRCMGVIVVGIASMGIVAMAMGMAEHLMAMPVAVLLPQQQQHA